MIVLPNSYERYLASLRICVSHLILKHGLKSQHLQMLKKITIAEAFYNKNSTQSVDINKLCTNLLKAIKAKGIAINFHISLNKPLLINKQLFSLLLLAISQKATHCQITADRYCIIIKSNTSAKPLTSLIAALGGYSLHERNHGRSLIIIPVKETSDPTVYTESEWEYLFDKFSLVNLFFTNANL